MNEMCNLARKKCFFSHSLAIWWFYLWGCAISLNPPQDVFLLSVRQVSFSSSHPKRWMMWRNTFFRRRLKEFCHTSLILGVHTKMGFFFDESFRGKNKSVGVKLCEMHCPLIFDVIFLLNRAQAKINYDIWLLFNSLTKEESSCPRCLREPVYVIFEFIVIFFLQIFTFRARLALDGLK